MHGGIGERVGFREMTKGSQKLHQKLPTLPAVCSDSAKTLCCVVCEGKCRNLQETKDVVLIQKEKETEQTPCRTLSYNA